ncbi:hypothetical protein Pst134EA_024614 [Puccinia striiformis f. sp. tritici]|uniref:hypothetical protein n=1 Tax=Puccinia striiformis f. sp. tritici TaxID=168172 RepID=UPI0020076325|nr:hypothetical protein Pst134EA_024614 [Puccinia striiformis f. sp. tritici]KAH9453751.1 hypothetical protein Pst134EA_024614 [Puccinia striiformis f. sp. tritici]KAI9629818.1 hypothetical protein KEM48_012574 [Puccinia striiformis f. sp. tritici PST-130]
MQTQTPLVCCSAFAFKSQPFISSSPSPPPSSASCIEPLSFYPQISQLHQPHKSNSLSLQVLRYIVGL